MLTTVNDNDPKSINISLHSLQTEIDGLQKTLDSIVKSLEGTTNYVLGEVSNIHYPVTSVNNKTGDVILTPFEVGALPNTTTHLSGDVPTSRKVNDKTLDNDITLTASDVGAVPTTRKVNGKTLSSDITLSASDVNALPNTYIAPVTSVNNKTGSVSITASDVGAMPYTSPDWTDISNQVTKNLGVEYVRAQKIGNFIYLTVSGTFTGEPKYDINSVLVENFPSGYSVNNFYNRYFNIIGHAYKSLNGEYHWYEADLAFVNGKLHFDGANNWPTGSYINVSFWYYANA